MIFLIPISAGDGWDVITDSDGQGQVVVGGVTFTGGEEKTKGSGVWYSADNTVQYALITESEGSQTLNIYNAASPSDYIFIKNYRRDQNLGINLQAGPAPVDTTIRIIIGDNLIDNLGNDRISGLGGQDRISAQAAYDMTESDSGDDWMQGEGGDDELYGGAGNDTMFGDTHTYNAPDIAGNDYLDGASATNDVLWRTAA